MGKLRCRVLKKLVLSYAASSDQARMDWFHSPGLNQHHTGKMGQTGARSGIQGFKGKDGLIRIWKSTLSTQASRRLDRDWYCRTVSNFWEAPTAPHPCPAWPPTRSHQDAIEELMGKEAQDTSQDVAHVVEELHVHDHGLVAPDKGATVTHEAHHEHNLVGQLWARAGHGDQGPTATLPAQYPAQRPGLLWSRSELLLLSLADKLMKMLPEMLLGLE